MRITVDRGSDTVHLRLTEGDGEADARALAEGVSVDYDAVGRLVGLTIRGIGRLTGAANAAATLTVDLGAVTPGVGMQPAEPAAASAPAAATPAAASSSASASATAHEPRPSTSLPTPPAAQAADVAPTTPAPFPAVAATEPSSASPSPTSPSPTPPAPATPPVPASAPAPAAARPPAAHRPSALLPLTMAERAALGPLTWEPDAEAAMTRVPFFQRGGRRIAVVETARARRLSVVTAALVEEMSGR